MPTALCPVHVQLQMSLPARTHIKFWHHSHGPLPQQTLLPNLIPCVTSVSTSYQL